MSKKGIIERKIRDLLASGPFTHKEISQRLNISRQRVSFLIGQMKKEAENSALENSKRIARVYPTFPLDQPVTSSENPKKVRLHGQEWQLKVISPSSSFLAYSKRHRFVDFKGHRICIERGHIIVFSNPEAFFIADSGQEALSASLTYWWALFRALEDRFHIVIFKGTNTDICQLKAHYALEDNEYSQDARLRGSPIKFKSPDGRVWLLADLSKGSHDLETIHPDTAKTDLEAIKPFFDDLREKNPGLTFTGLLGDIKALLMPADPPDKRKPDYIG